MAESNVAVDPTVLDECIEGVGVVRQDWGEAGHFGLEFIVAGGHVGRI